MIRLSRPHFGPITARVFISLVRVLTRRFGGRAGLLTPGANRDGRPALGEAVM